MNQTTMSKTPSATISRYEYHGKFLLILLAALLSTSAIAEPLVPPLKVLAAGSLKTALTSIISEWQRIHPELPVTLQSGPAGWLRERIEKGEVFDIYASAALTHAEALNREGWTGPAVLFAHNRMCALVKADSPVTSQTIIDTLLLPATRIATSTPRVDPAGDYTWEFFHRLDQQHPGAYAALTARAKPVFGGPPDAKNRPRPLSALIATGEFDVGIGYCSGRAKNGDSALKYVELPAPAPVADYGLAVSRKSGTAAAEFAMFVLSPLGQRMLADNGFIGVGLPSR
jgi:ABC-type molybdate transport system substrate-binding protein